MIWTIQIMGILFALFMAYLVFTKKKREEITLNEMLIWFMVWLSLLAISVFPTMLDFFIKETLYFGRRLDFFVIIGFFFLIGMSFYNYLAIRKQEKRFNILVRKITLQKKE